MDKKTKPALLPGDCSTRQKTGFTLVELLIVIAILATLATAVVLVINPAQMLSRARDATRASDIKTIQRALQLFSMNNNGRYPSTGGVWCSPESWNVHFASCTPNGDYIPGLVAAGHIPRHLRDPNASLAIGNDSGYLYRSDGRDFKFLIHLTPEDCSNPRFASLVDPLRVCGPGSSSWAAWTPGAVGW